MGIKEYKGRGEPLALKKGNSPPAVGDNFSRCNGYKLYDFDVRGTLNKVSLPAETKGDILAGRLCVALYDPDGIGPNTARYLIVYDCSTYTIYAVQWVP